MDELQQETNQELETGTSASAEQTQELTTVEPSQDEANQQQPYWQQHENFKKGFWKSEEDAIKGYDYYDKKYRPFESELKRRGYELDGLTDVLNKYEEYADPQSEINMSYQAIQNLINHPKYGQQFNDFVAKIVEEAEIEKYGMRLPQEVKEKLNKIEQFEQREQQREQQEKTQALKGEIDTSINQIREFCKTKGFEITDEDLKAHIQDCINNNIGINRIYENFLVKNLDKLLGNVQNAAQKTVVNNLQNNKKSSVPTTSRIAPAQKMDVTSRENLHSRLTQIFNKGE